MTLAPLRLDLRNAPSELARIRGDVHAWLDGAGGSPELRFDLDLVLEELVTNLFKHGAEAERATGIAVVLSVDDRHVLCRFTDDGPPFDPRDVPPPELPPRIEDRRPGGIGLHLVRGVAEIVDYRRAEEKNVLDVRLREPLPVD